MRSQTYKILLEITGKLDPVPGTFNKVEDHENYLTRLIEDFNYVGRFNEKGEFENPGNAVKIIATEVYGSDHQTKMIEKMMERHPESGIWQMKEK